MLGRDFNLKIHPMSDRRANNLAMPHPLYGPDMSKVSAQEPPHSICLEKFDYKEPKKSAEKRKKIRTRGRHSPRNGEHSEDHHKLVGFRI
jgi:hypothetical protein